MKKKIMILGSADSIHLYRWCEDLKNSSFDLIMVTQHNVNFEYDKSIKIYQLKYKGLIGYFLNSPIVRKIIELEKPDIIHAHYASGYGTTLRLTKTKVPSLLSIWGSDIYLFPKKSKIHTALIKKNLQFASNLASTSKDMKDEVRKYTDKKVYLTPFGVDVNHFIPNKFSDDRPITIGTVKGMKDVYGIKYLIDSFKLLSNDIEINKKLRFLIVGGGSQLNEYIEYAKKNKVDIQFTGQIEYYKLPNYFNELDIYCAPSLSESFGVAVLEASACELPVIVTDVGGLPEVVVNDKTGIIIKSKSSFELYSAIKRLILDDNLRKSMGISGRNFVNNNYSRIYCANQLIKVYNDIIKNN